MLAVIRCRADIILTEHLNIYMIAHKYESFYTNVSRNVRPAPAMRYTPPRGTPHGPSTRGGDCYLL
jgi:hypothetical protein